MKVRTTFVVTVDCELDKCCTRNLDLTISNCIEEQENMQGAIMDGFGYPFDIEIKVQSVRREPYYNIEVEGNEKS
jgi:hypothetical protein